MMKQRPYIDLERAWQLDQTLDGDWLKFVDSIKDRLVFRLEPIDESLTFWDAECYVKDEHGKLTGEITTIQIKHYIPGKPEWLVKP